MLAYAPTITMTEFHLITLKQCVPQWPKLKNDWPVA